MNTLRAELRRPLRYNIEYWGLDKTAPAFFSRILAVHAARVQTPYITLKSRHNDICYKDLYDYVYLKKKAIKIRCIRNTLHITSLENAALLHYSTLRFRKQRCDALAKHVPEFKRFSGYAKERILECLTDGMLGERAIEKKLTDIPTPVTRLALKYAWEEGVICLLDESTEWNKERRVFAILKDTFGSILERQHDDHEYIRNLCRSYFEHYGPASLSDLLWWSGLTVSEVTPAIDWLLKTGQIESVCIAEMKMFQSPQREQLELDEESDSVFFLPWEDFALKAYYETRWRYAQPEHLKLAFNSIGEIRRTVFIDGRVIGVWEVDDEGVPSQFKLFSGDSQLQKHVETEFDAFSRNISDESAQGRLL